MEYKGAKLRGRIVEVFGTLANFADAMGLSARTISLKLAGHIDWKGSEIALACKLLHIDQGEMGPYFLPQ